MVGYNYIAQYVFGLLIGCVNLVSEPKNSIICSSVEHLKNLEYTPDKFDVTILGKYKQKCTLKKTDVVNIRHIKFLSCFYALDGIENGTLRELEHLEHFYSGANHLPVIKASYFDNPNVKSITLLDSHIQDIEAGAFLKLPSIEYAWITQNNISVIKRGAFENTNFNFIHLDNNKIKVIENGAFFGMNNLEGISLVNNLLKTFDSNKLIGKSLGFANLQIAENFLTEITRDMTSPLPNLVYFNVSRNLIENIESCSFQDFEQLAVLDLSRNKIGELKPDLFNKNNNLTQLFLHSNQLTYISDEILINLTHLKNITIIGNPWQCSCRSVLKDYIEKNNVDDHCGNLDDNHKCIARENIQCVYDLDKSQIVKDVNEYKKLGEGCYSI